MEKSFENPSPQEFGEKNQEKEALSEADMIKRGLGKIFDENEAGKERVEALILKIKPFLEASVIGSDKVGEELSQCSDIEDREEFVEKAFSALQPLWDFKNNNPQEFEEIHRRSFVEQGGFTKINEVLSYGESGDLIHIHLAPAKEMGIGELRSLIKDGFEKLADIAERSSHIKKITATSWIVASHPKIMKMLGFTIEGEIDEGMRGRHFSNEERPIHRAVITREDFLKKYRRKT